MKQEYTLLSHWIDEGRPRAISGGCIYLFGDRYVDRVKVGCSKYISHGSRPPLTHNPGIYHIESFVFLEPVHNRLNVRTVEGLLHRHLEQVSFVDFRELEWFYGDDIDGKALEFIDRKMPHVLSIYK